MNVFVRSCIRFVCGRLLPKVAYPVVRGPLRGAKFILGAFAGEGGGSSVYFNMIEGEQTAAFMDILHAGHVLLDIGANAGYYTVLGARLVGAKGRVVAVEPAIRNLVYLYKHTLLNKTKNVSIIPAACSDTVSIAVFSNGENFATGHLENCHQGGNSIGRVSYLVPTVTIDMIVQRLGAFPDAIKVDVEGAEYYVLKGAHVTLREARPCIFLSTHSAELRKNCLNYLTEIGYKIEILSSDKEDPTEFLAR